MRTTAEIPTAIPERVVAVSEGIVDTLAQPPVGRNGVAARFYDGPGWPRFRFWERWFLRIQGGEARARRQILRHLDAPAGAHVLEVGIGDGANLPLIPATWTAHGVDLARNQLLRCQADHPDTTGRLAYAEAESLPFPDAVFDACWTLGGFNHFSDHASALREMDRVTRPGGVVVVADEIPTLPRFAIGNLIGIPAVDVWWLTKLGLTREFATMVLDCGLDPRVDIPAIYPNATSHSIWGGLGYCFVHRKPTSPDPSTPGVPR